jgi:hypothetical protein
MSLRSASGIFRQVRLFLLSKRSQSIRADQRLDVPVLEKLSGSPAGIAALDAVNGQH